MCSFGCPITHSVDQAGSLRSACYGGGHKKQKSFTLGLTLLIISLLHRESYLLLGTQLTKGVKSLFGATLDGGFLDCSAVFFSQASAAPAPALGRRPDSQIAADSSPLEVTSFSSHHYDPEGNTRRALNLT